MESFRPLKSQKVVSSPFPQYWLLTKSILIPLAISTFRPHVWRIAYHSSHEVDLSPFAQIAAGFTWQNLEGASVESSRPFGDCLLHQLPPIHKSLWEPLYHRRVCLSQRCHALRVSQVCWNKVSRFAWIPTISSFQNSKVLHFPRFLHFRILRWLALHVSNIFRVQRCLALRDLSMLRTLRVSSFACFKHFQNFMVSDFACF